MRKTAPATTRKAEAQADDRLARIATAGASVVDEVIVRVEGVLFAADNLPLMQALPDACCDFVYADPPFMSGRRRTSASDAAGFDDRWPGEIAEYLAFLRPRLEQMRRLLSSRGLLCVHLDWRTVHYVKVELDRLFGYAGFLNEIIWHYRTGGRCKRWFARKHDTLLLYARNAGEHTFNLQRDGTYRTDGLKYDQDGRPFKSTTNGRVYFHPDGPALTDVWEIPFLSTVSSERTGYPSQKPLALLERLVASCSDPGDVVADFFCGSGTSLLAAARAGRAWVGCDREQRAVETAARRLTKT